jgi:riboflavin biosynthesis pyrimidine reductase
VIKNLKNKKKINFFKKLGIKIIHQKNLKNKDNLKFFYKKLKKMGFSRIFVESGLTYLNHLITNKIINNLYLFVRNNFYLFLFELRYYIFIIKVYNFFSH